MFDSSHQPSVDWFTKEGEDQGHFKTKDLHEVSQVQGEISMVANETSYNFGPVDEF